MNQAQNLFSKCSDLKDILLPKKTLSFRLWWQMQELKSIFKGKFFILSWWWHVSVICLKVQLVTRKEVKASVQPAQWPGICPVVGSNPCWVIQKPLKVASKAFLLDTHHFRGRIEGLNHQMVSWCGCGWSATLPQWMGQIKIYYIVFIYLYKFKLAQQLHSKCYCLFFLINHVFEKLPGRVYEQILIIFISHIHKFLHQWFDAKCRNLHLWVWSCLSCSFGSVFNWQKILIFFLWSLFC